MKASKSVFLILVICLLSNAGLTQKVTYKTVKDDPEDITNLVVNVEPIYFDMGNGPFPSIPGIALALGVTGKLDLFKRLGVETALRQNYFATYGDGDEKLGRQYFYQLGGHFRLLDKVRTKDAKVVIGGSSNGSYTTTNYLTVPASHRSTAEVRFGLNRNALYLDSREVFEDGVEVDAPRIKYVGTGFYAGVSFSSIYNICLDVEGYGLKSNSILNKLYVDVLFVPLNSFESVGSSTEPNADVKDLVRDKGVLRGDSPIGFRVGWEMYKVEKKEFAGRSFSMVYDWSLGVRPNLGFYVGVGCGITVFKTRVLR